MSTNTQLGLFDRGPGGRQVQVPLPTATSVPFQAHSTTSREAAAKQRRSGTAASLESWVLDFFRVLGSLGATDEELDGAGRHAGLVFATLRPRRIAWWHKGYVVAATEADGTPRRRRNRHGNRMQVWIWSGKEPAA